MEFATTANVNIAQGAQRSELLARVHQGRRLSLTLCPPDVREWAVLREDLEIAPGLKVITPRSLAYEAVGRFRFHRHAMSEDHFTAQPTGN